LINNLIRQDGFDREMVAWLLAFYGQLFCPNVAVVTNFWTGEGAMLRNLNVNLRQRLDEEWAQLQAYGAQHHAFGKDYINDIPQESTISLFDPARREELEQQARSMVTRYCHSETTPSPQILRELGEPRPLHRTSAGKIFPPQNQQVPRGCSTRRRRTTKRSLRCRRATWTKARKARTFTVDPLSGRIRTCTWDGVEYSDRGRDRLSAKANQRTI
jgi:hypothetical protein